NTSARSQEEAARDSRAAGTTLRAASGVGCKVRTAAATSAARTKRCRRRTQVWREAAGAPAPSWAGARRVPPAGPSGGWGQAAVERHVVRADLQQSAQVEGGGKPLLGLFVTLGFGCLPSGIEPGDGLAVGEFLGVWRLEFDQSHRIALCQSQEAAIGTACA